MQSTYLKIRDPFNFSPHPYEIGPPIIRSSFIENHLFLKIYKLTEQQYEPFYHFHLNYFLQNHPNKEEDFFSYMWEILEDRTLHFKRQDPFSAKHLTYQSNIQKLKPFQKFLISVDQWKKHQPLESVIAEKDQEISTLKSKVSALEEEVRQFKEYEPIKKIQIRENYLGTFLDLILQLQELSLPDKNPLLKSKGQSAWYKMIAKYFLHGDSEIPINTSRNYFPAQKDTINIKGTEISEKQKLFKINNLKNRP